jgi:transposase
VFRKCGVVLSDDQEARLLEMVSRGVASARTIRRAHTLLYSWEGYSDERIAELLHCSPNTVANTRKAFRDRGLASLHEKPRPGAKRRLDGHAEAHLVALACSEPPEGRSHWSMQLLADSLVTLSLTDSVSAETVRRVLKNKRSSRG